MSGALAMLWVILIDVLFVAVLAALVWPLSHFRCAAFAVLRRNFIGYFSNPTGYVFLCIFVLLTSIAAFWPHEFWVSNLANLDQLNRFLPYIMLVFIPAITMSIWAEERRQGTDELLLTLPADDFDIVMGKYLAAAAIFTASLLFSQLASSAVLISLTLGDLDVGLLLTTYFGYWLIGLAMLAIGMVASFLTSNLTVGFILGAVFNLPLAFAAFADVIIPTTGRAGFINWQTLSQAISRWSLSNQFDSFGRGVINFSSVTYFGMLAVIGLYLSMVLIGKRHWSGGRDGTSRLGHYLARVLSLLVIAAAVNVFISNYDVIRVDATDGKISSLSPQTRKLIRDLNPEHTIYVDAYLSEKVPETYVQTKYDLLSMLKEFRAMSSQKINVRIYDNLEPSSAEAVQAAERYGILPQTVRTFSQGSITDAEVLLGAAFTCGLEKVIVPFFEPGVPVEYELVRSINTVVKPKRGRLGILRTDAQINGGFSFAGGMPRQLPRQEILDELGKQYDIENVEPTSEIDVDKFDVLMVVQPSSLDPMGLENLLAAIRKGIPTAIFEDPRPLFIQAPATGEPKQSPGGMFGGGPPPEKCDIKQLWKLLGLDIPGKMGSGFPPLFQPDLVWQKYNPYPKLQISGIPDEWVFASPSAPDAADAFNATDPVTSGLDEVLFTVPGAIRRVRSSELEFIELVKTGKAAAGTTQFQDFMEMQRDPSLEFKLTRKSEGEQILAVRLRGKLPSDEAGNDNEKPQEGDKPNEKPLHVIYVADMDLMSSPFVRLRARPGESDEIHWRFENVTFMLNIIDSLAGEDSYLEIRKRKLRHSTLRMVEASTQKARDHEAEERNKFQKNFEDALAKAKQENEKIEKNFETQYNKLVEQQQRGESVNPAEVAAANTALMEQKANLDRRLQVEEERLKRERDTQIKKIALEVDREIKGIQKRYKYIAVIIPPIPPLLVGVVVFFQRRLREREGISRARLR
jgi:ABC-2 type transport system permease protein